MNFLKEEHKIPLDFCRDCPVCREVDIEVRNIFAEKSIVFLTIPCEYKQFGCKEDITFSDKEMVKYRDSILKKIAEL